MLDFSNVTGMQDYHIVNTTMYDIENVSRLFRQAMAMQEKDGYKVWRIVDREILEKDINEMLQYKIVEGDNILCVFSIQLSDPFIWRSRDKNDAIYLHRIVANPEFKGQRQFPKVLDWAKQFARQHGLKFVRMDTWADNQKIINYYKSSGFKFIEQYRTTDTPELPMQNRNLDLALLELELNDN